MTILYMFQAARNTEHVFFGVEEHTRIPRHGSRQRPCKASQARRLPAVITSSRASAIARSALLVEVGAQALAAIFAI